jgi:hypothetical protein
MSANMNVTDDLGMNHVRVISVITEALGKGLGIVIAHLVGTHENTDLVNTAVIEIGNEKIMTGIMNVTEGENGSAEIGNVKIGIKGRTGIRIVHEDVIEKKTQKMPVDRGHGHPYLGQGQVQGQGHLYPGNRVILVKLRMLKNLVNQVGFMRILFNV